MEEGSEGRGWYASPAGERRLSSKAVSPSRPASCGLQEWADWTVRAMAAAVELGTVGMSSCCWFELLIDVVAGAGPEWLKLRVRPTG